MAKSKPARSNRTQTVDDIADEHDVDAETVRRWVRKGCPARKQGAGKPTLLDSAEVERWKRENGVTGKIGRPAHAEDSPDLEKARLRKENALAAKYELQVARDRAELLPSADIRRWIVQAHTRFRNKLRGMAASVTPHLEGRDAAERQTILEQWIDECLNELADSVAGLGREPSAT